MQIAMVGWTLPSTSFRFTGPINRESSIATEAPLA